MVADYARLEDVQQQTCGGCAPARDEDQEKGRQLPFRAILRQRLEEPFRGYVRRTEDRVRLSMEDRVSLYQQGQLLERQVWGYRPADAVAR